jgi:ATP-dependent Lhr-like helicase
LERLEAIASGGRIQRIGLSATQKPIEEVARFLVGNRSDECTIIDEGHRREIDLAIEIPRSPLDAVMSHEVWEEYYERLTQLISEHRTTLIFVNTRKMAERTARHLSERLGEDAVTAHHGSLSKEIRLDAEHRLKNGSLKALVATASLELGIDIGHVDLVCQVGSPHRIATLLQRVGRSGHTIAGTPKGRLLPASRDDLIECAALLRSVRQGELDRIVSLDAPLDVLAQQIAAEASSREMREGELFDFVRRAWPYRSLERGDFDAVVSMLAEGFSTRRGRRAALVHRDEVHSIVKGRRGTRMLALTSGGAIPEIADYRVVVEPEDTFIGTLNEDFAIESNAGDIFQLGNASWQVVKVGSGTVRVRDAHGAPPTIPFWLGEAPARSDELSRAVSDLRRDFRDAEWLMAETGLCEGGAEQAASYLDAGRTALGVIPTQETLVLERFFDESGGMQLVLHAPFGSRINKAWTLALRKRFCRQFNFELQAAATEDALLLSLGPQHSFPLSDVFRYLHPATTRDILVQAMLDAPLFKTRWRWNTTISLAVPRSRGGSKVPPQLQRMHADDLMAAIFPDAAACVENIPGDREIPDHPLVNQTVRDCLEEAMDFEGLTRVLTRIHAGELCLVARDTPEPSPFAHEIINAKPYAFLDDAPLEERRTHAVQTRMAADQAGSEMGVLDADAIARVRDEVRPDPRDADELHDALLTTGLLSSVDIPIAATELIDAGRATWASLGTVRILVAAERLPELQTVHPNAVLNPPITAPPGRAARTWTRESAIVELLRGRLAIVGPTTACDLGATLSIAESEANAALLALESEGAVLRGMFQSRTPNPESRVQWCDRRLLARIHRYTLHRLRAEIAPVSAADFMRFLFAWQHVEGSSRLIGIDGLREVIAQLDGIEAAARAWERTSSQPALTSTTRRCSTFSVLQGAVAWARLSSGPTQVVGATPIALFCVNTQTRGWPCRLWNKSLWLLPSLTTCVLMGLHSPTRSRPHANLTDEELRNRDRRARGGRRHQLGRVRGDSVRLSVRRRLARPRDSTAQVHPVAGSLSANKPNDRTIRTIRSGRNVRLDLAAAIRRDVPTDARERGA